MDTYRIPSFFDENENEDFGKPCHLFPAGEVAVKTKIKYPESFGPQTNRSDKKDCDTLDGQKRLQQTLADANKTLSTLKKLKLQQGRSSQLFNELVELCINDTHLASNVWQKLGNSVYECCKDPNLKFSESIKHIRDSVRKKRRQHPLGKVQNKVICKQQQPATSLVSTSDKLKDLEANHHAALDGWHRKIAPGKKRNNNLNNLQTDNLKKYGVVQEDRVRHVSQKYEIDGRKLDAKEFRRVLIGRFAQGCSVHQLVKEFGCQYSGLIYQVLIQDQQDIQQDLMDQLLRYLEADYSFAEILEIYGNSVTPLLHQVALSERHEVSLKKMKKREEERARQKKLRDNYTYYVDHPKEHFDMKLIDEVKQELGIKKSLIERTPVSDAEIENVLSVWFPDCGLI